MTAGLTGRDPNANVNVLRRFRCSQRKQPYFFAPSEEGRLLSQAIFVEDKKLDSNLGYNLVLRITNIC